MVLSPNVYVPTRNRDATMLQAWSPLAVVGTLALAVFLFHPHPPSRVTVLVARPSHAQPPAEWQRSARSVTRATGPLTAAQVDRYYEDGFLVLPSFVGQGLLTRLQEDVEVQIDKLARRLYRSGKVRTLPNTTQSSLITTTLSPHITAPLAPLPPAREGKARSKISRTVRPSPDTPNVSLASVVPHPLGACRRKSCTSLLTTSLLSDPQPHTHTHTPVRLYDCI